MSWVRDPLKAPDPTAWLGEAAMSEPVPDLTSREHEVLACLADGLMNVEIARRLHVAPSTVKAHLRSLFPKLGVSNRTQAAVAYLRMRSGAAYRA